MNGTAEENEAFHRKAGVPTRHEPVYTGVPTIEFDDSRDEKPWQRVPSTLLVLVLGLYLLLGYFTQLNEDAMPSVINEADVGRDNSETFSEEAAWRYLNIILGDQPRVSGTRYHLQKTMDLKNLLDSIATQGNQGIRTDWQMTNGDYWIQFSPPHVNCYQNVSNVIALLEGESGFHSNGTIGTTLLVNCHYDSVPYALGASDNAIFCAVMMETLSKLSRRSQRLRHNVVFLFNGAEENPLQGSHAFLQHPWSRGITNVINLDAAGMNGKPIMFQVTDPRLLAIYKRVTSRPSGQSIGEFLFSSGIIPSDTDFRVWRDFGNFHGVDIAFVKWGHVYHTRYDHPDLVRAGVIQNAGDMLLALVREAANDAQLQTQIEPSAAVYFDFLYAFMVTYTYGAAIAGDLLTAAYACLGAYYYVWLVGARWSTAQELLYAVLSRLASMLAGVVTCAVLAPIMIAAMVQMRYLSEPWVVVPYFWLPYVIAAVCASQLFDAWRAKKCGLNRSVRCLQAMAATRLLLAAVLVILTCIPAFRTVTYMFSVPLFLMTTFSLISITVLRYVRLQAWQHLLMEVSFSIPTMMFLFSLALKFSAVLLPTVGRSSSNWPDYTVAILSVGLAVICSSAVSGIELLFSRRRLWWVAVPLSLACIIIMFIPFDPFRDEGPSTQRHYWFHSEIISYDINNAVTSRVSGVLVTKHDAYSTARVSSALRARGLQVQYRTTPAADCDTYVHCNVPLFRLRFGNFLSDSMFLYTGPPAPFTPESSTQVVSRACAADACTYNMRMIGQAHNMLTIWPRAHVNLTSWSFLTPLQPSFEQGARPVYVIIHSTATYSEVFAPLDFTLTFTVPVSQQSEPVMDLSHHSHKINHPEDYTTEYRNLVEAMPLYFNIASFLSFRKNYVF